MKSEIDLGPEKSYVCRLMLCSLINIVLNRGKEIVVFS